MWPTPELPKENAPLPPSITPLLRGERVCSVQTIFGQGRFFRSGRPHFLLEKLRIFRNLCSVPTDKEEGIEPVRTVCGQEKVNFLRFCADVLYVFDANLIVCSYFINHRMQMLSQKPKIS